MASAPSDTARLPVSHVPSNVQYACRRSSSHHDHHPYTPYRLSEGNTEDWAAGECIVWRCEVWAVMR